MKNKLSVSLMCADLINLESQIKQLELVGIDYLHIDIMDASFVPNITFGIDTVNAISEISSIPLDIHLLVDHPKTIIRSLNIKKNDIVSIHSECKESIMENAAFIKQHGAQFGLALNPDTCIEEVKKYLPYVDIILLMLIVPGFAGSTMIHGMMEKVSDTRQFLNVHKYNNIEIEVDGSVSCEKALIMKNMGASIFVGGTSGIFIKGVDIEDSISEFYKHIQ